MTRQQLDFLGITFWKLLAWVVFFPPNNFWQGSNAIILGLYFLDIFGDARARQPARSDTQQ
jgi:hypothetical protein